MGSCSSLRAAAAAGKAATQGVPPPPPGTTGTGTGTTGAGTSTTTGGTTGGPMACPCAPGSTMPFCTAVVGAGQIERPDDAAFECRAQCVPMGAASLWCFDDSSCCDPTVTCDAHGFCGGALPVGTGTGSGTGTGTSTG